MSSQTLFVAAGSTDVTIDIGPLLQDAGASTPGDSLTGLVYNSSGLTCYYREGATGTVTQLSLATQTVGGAHSDGGFVELDSTNMPGMYRLDLSDTIVSGSNVFGTITLTGAADLSTHTIHLVMLVPSNAVEWSGQAIPTPSVTGRPLVDVRNVDGSAHDLATATALATVDTVVDSILADTGTDGVKLDMSQVLPASPTADTTGDAMKQSTREEAPKKNTALSDIPVYMVDSTDHVTPETGLSITVEVSQDGGAFGAVSGSISEISDGVYSFDAAAADMNADTIVFKFTASGADPQVIAMSTVA